MAKRQVVSYSVTCDVCGDSVSGADDDSATRKVSWEGTDYVLDVCVTHGAQLGDVLAQLKGFVDAGRRETGRRGRRPDAIAAPSATPKARRGRRAATSAANAGTAPKRGDLGAIRAWARDQGMKVNERGRIPAALLEAYDAAQSAPAPEPAPAATPRKRAGRPRKKAAGG